MKHVRSGHVRHILVPVMAVSLLCTCCYWKVQELAPAQVVTEKQPDRVRLRMLDHRWIEITDPMISDGQIVGHPVGKRYSVGSDTLRVPTDSVAYVLTRGTHVFRITLAVVLGVVATVGCYFLNWDHGY